MAKTSAANTGGSQFFIVPSDSTPSHLDGVHTVFGMVTDGLDIITEISRYPLKQETDLLEMLPWYPLKSQMTVLTTRDSTSSEVIHEVKYSDIISSALV